MEQESERGKEDQLSKYAQRAARLRDGIWEQWTALTAISLVGETS